MKCAFYKMAGGLLRPADESSVESMESWKVGDYLICNIVKPRNPAFHRKGMALLRYGFDCWEPDHIKNVCKKNFDQFRRDVTIMAGHYDIVYTIGGGLRKVANSLSFGSMDDNEFEDLYNKFSTVLIEHVLQNHTRDDLDEVIERILEFTQ